MEFFVGQMPGPAGIQRILDIFRAFYRSIKKM